MPPSTISASLITDDKPSVVQVDQHAAGTDSDDDYPIFSRRREPSPSKASKLKQPAKEMTTVPPSTSSIFQTFKISPNAHLGQVAPREQRFSPLFAVMKYPYRYLKGEISERVSKGYFAEGKFQKKVWTLFFVHTLLQSARPLILVPAAEVETLFSKINAEMNLQIGFPDAETDPSFVLSFLQVGTPRPRYLGRLMSKEGLSELEKKIPEPGASQYGEEAMDPSIIGPWKAMMEAAVRAGKGSSKQSKEKRKKDRILGKMMMCNQLKRTRCYIGLSPRSNALTDPLAIPTLDWNEYQAAAEEHAKKSAMLRNIDVNEPTPNELHQDVVFISVDVESYERIPNTITEIGISTLDTRDIHCLAPGNDGKAWMQKIRSRHFRIKENAHLENSDFVSGCAGRFEKDFGTSEWISIKDAPHVVDSCFQHPFSASAFSHHPTEASNEDNSERKDPQPSPSAPEISDAEKAERKIILVGHDVKADIEYLNFMGYDVSKLDNILEALDTAEIFRAYMHEHQPRNLGSVILALGLTGWNLHNAGNDAAYTLQALIGTCFRSLDPDRRAMIKREHEINIKQSSEEAKQQIIQDAAEWEVADMEEGDGGEAVRMCRRKTATSQTSKTPTVEDRIEETKIEEPEHIAQLADEEDIESPKPVVTLRDRGAPLDTIHEGDYLVSKSENISPHATKNGIARPSVQSAQTEAKENISPPEPEDLTISALKLARLARLDKMNWTF